MNVIHELIHLTSLAQIGQDKLAMKVAQKLVENQNDVINQIMKLDDGGMIPDSKARNAAVRIMYYIAKGGKVKLEELNNVNTGNTQFVKASPKIVNRVARLIAEKNRKNQEVTKEDLAFLSGIEKQLVNVRTG